MQIVGKGYAPDNRYVWTIPDRHNAPHRWVCGSIAYILNTGHCGRVGIKVVGEALIEFCKLVDVTFLKRPLPGIFEVKIESRIKEKYFGDKIVILSGDSDKLCKRIKIPPPRGTAAFVFRVTVSQPFPKPATSFEQVWEILSDIASRFTCYAKAGEEMESMSQEIQTDAPETNAEVPELPDNMAPGAEQLIATPPPDLDTDVYVAIETHAAKNNSGYVNLAWIRSFSQMIRIDPNDIDNAFKRLVESGQILKLSIDDRHSVFYPPDVHRSVSPVQRRVLLFAYHQLPEDRTGYFPLDRQLIAEATGASIGAIKQSLYQIYKKGLLPSQRVDGRVCYRRGPKLVVVKDGNQYSLSDLDQEVTEYQGEQEVPVEPPVPADNQGEDRDAEGLPSWLITFIEGVKNPVSDTQERLTAAEGIKQGIKANADSICALLQSVPDVPQYATLRAGWTNQLANTQEQLGHPSLNTDADQALLKEIHRHLVACWNEIGKDVEQRKRQLRNGRHRPELAKD